MIRCVETDAGRVTYALIRTVRGQAQAVALPGGIVRVYAPAGLSLRAADELVRQQAAALKARLALLDGPQRRDGCLPVEGVPHRLCTGCADGVSRIENGVLHLHDDDAPETLLLPLARRRIAERLPYWHARISGEYVAAAVEEMGVKWGACTQARALSFNYRLILAPPEALDYVIIHELCHLHEFSHSPRFWHMVKAQMPDYEAWKKWLSDHKSELVLP